MDEIYAALYAELVLFISDQRYFSIQDRTLLHHLISNIIREHRVEPLCINSTRERVHMLFKYNVDTLLSDLEGDIRNNTALQMKSCRAARPFSWKEESWLISHGVADLELTEQYIKDVHHSRQHECFRRTFIRTMKELRITYSSDDIFDWRME